MSNTAKSFDFLISAWKFYIIISISNKIIFTLREMNLL